MLKRHPVENRRCVVHSGYGRMSDQKLLRSLPRAVRTPESATDPADATGPPP